MTLLPRKSARSQGVHEQGIVDFLDAIAGSGIELHGFMLLKHGAVVAQTSWAPYERDAPHLLYSLSKSFLSVAAGIAESEGLLSMQDCLADRLPEAADYGEATIADALRMSVGHLFDPVLDPSQDNTDVSDAALRRMLRSYAPERAPGEVFTYDQLATFAVAKIIEDASGTSLMEYLRPRILDPIGATEARWYGGEQNFGFSGLYLRTESIAAFGQLLLQRGEWQGRQLIPRDWLAAATSIQMPNDSAHRFPPGQPVDSFSAGGYGYQFWINPQGYLAGGAYGQTCLVLPQLDAVVAITASTEAGQRVLEHVWTHLLPALAGGGEREPDHSDSLAARLANLSVPAPIAGLPEAARTKALATLGMLAAAVTALRGEAADARWPQIAAGAAQRAEEAMAVALASRSAAAPLAPPELHDVGQVVFERKLTASAAPDVRFGALGALDLPELTQVRLLGSDLELTLGGQPSTLPVGSSDWRRGEVGGDLPIPFATRGGWSPEGRFEAELRMVETPHVGYLSLDPGTASFTFTWREPTLMGRDLSGYRI
ncbi:serine hydrolase domain-containing protein [Galactobacter caseinivorans]|uniref:Beta-lactamase-related domain-containing protein n=1 Tax=Galactobacter caseinivorans TaxID=2676123 RepID=A0A496PHH5_9MICC|nr:serine hydrolase domain-containing protein [Galactobacter caseinivorans]RKW69937.1 hypothetical protein DWQ67_10760 [Galactobacter caseinivorans]